MARQGTWLASAAVAAGVSAGAAIPAVGPIMNPNTMVSSLEAHETHAGASLLGQFRTTSAAWLYLRADLYLHNGVEMRALTDEERRHGKRGAGGDEDHHHESDKLHDDSSIVTVVPNAEDDFRGVFGDVERATSAYRRMEGHHHNDPMTVMPLFRLTTWVDPSFITGWCLGAMVMARDPDPKGVDRAIDYLKEGLKSNPKSIEILTQLGSMHVARKQQIETGLGWLEQARFAARSRAGKMNQSEAEATTEAFRWLALVYQHQKRSKEQFEAAAEGLKLCPDDKVLLRLAK